MKSPRSSGSGLCRHQRGAPGAGRARKPIRRSQAHSGPQESRHDALTEPPARTAHQTVPPTPKSVIFTRPASTRSSPVDYNLHPLLARGLDHYVTVDDKEERFYVH